MKNIWAPSRGWSEVALLRRGSRLRISWLAGRSMLWPLVASMCLSACRRPPPVQEQATRHAALGQDRIAMVGADPVSKDTVVRVRAASKLSTEQALGQIVQLRLLGAWASSGGLSQGRRTVVERALLARRLLEAMDARAREPEEPSDSEYEAMIRERWFELDRPTAWKVAHFVVLTESVSETAAQELAQRIATAVKGTTEEGAFLEKARTYPKGSFKVVAESLPPVTADGRTLLLDRVGKPNAEGGTFDRDFAQAAAKLEHIGAQSGLVRTAYGLHVLLLTNRLDGYVLPLTERKPRLMAEIVKRRAEVASRQLLERLRKVEPPELERAALEWTGRVRIAE